MPVKWRYLCCICDSTDNKRRYSARHEYTIRRQHNRRAKSGTNTWARRSLLDNEQSELNDIPNNQMREIPTPTHETGDHSFQGRLLDHFASRKRPTVHDVFENSIDENSISKTTFPWMDERFVPNGRTGTRLGISSVQINTKHNEAMIPNKSPKEPSVVSNSISSPTSPTHTFVSSMNSQSFTDGQHLAHGRSDCSCVVNSNLFPKNIKHIQNGNILRNKISTTPKVVNNINRPVHLGASSSYHNKPMLLKAPTSDVGVKRISLHPLVRQDRIPKLEDYTGFSGAGYTANDHNINADHRPTVMDIFPGIFPSNIHNTTTEADTDISFSSEVTFRKQPSEYSGNNVSLKSSSGPGMFSSKTNKYERLTLQSTKSKSKYAKDTSSESMYGYVPKIVQNVHASNALEGSKIDDFFLQRLGDRQLENFGSLTRGNMCIENVEPMIITSITERTDDLTVTANRMVSEHRGARQSATTATHLENRSTPNASHLHRCEYNSPAVASITTLPMLSNTTCTTNRNTNADIRTNNTQLKTNSVREETNSVREETNSVREETDSVREETNSVREETNSVREETNSVREETNSVREETNSAREETDSNVIMIDFPPNMENDKQLTTPIDIKIPPSSPVSVGSDPSALAKATGDPPPQPCKPNSEVNMETMKDNLYGITIEEVLY